MTKFIKNHFVSLILLSLFIGFVSYRIYTADPQGYCSSEYRSDVINQYLSDEYFIKKLLSENFRSEISRKEGGYKGMPEDEKKIEAKVVDYLANHPACCKVYRESADGIEVHSNLWDRAFWHFQTVAIKVSDERNTEGGYAIMSICGRYLDAR